MKKIITFFVSMVLIALNVTAQDLYIRFNKVPDGSGLVTGSQSAAENVAKPITFDDETEAATDAYLMDAPQDGDIYTKSFTLPAGDYEYQVVFADGTGTQGEKGAWYSGRPFTVSEDKEIIFRAKINGGFIRFLCDAQELCFSSFSDGKSIALFTDQGTNGIAQIKITDPNYKGTSLQAQIFPKGSNTFVCDVLPIGKGKYSIPGGANGKVRWLIEYNRNTLTALNAIKLVTLLDSDSIDTGNGSAPADELLQTMPTPYSDENPLLIKGGTRSVSAIIGVDVLAGAEKANNLLKIVPANIEAKMYYTVALPDDDETLSSGSQTLSTTADVNTADYYTIWASDTPVDVTAGLENGTYILKVWFETVYLGDTVKSAEYPTTFSVSTTVGIDNPELSTSIYIKNGTINATFNGTASIELYNISGLLIDKATATDNYMTAVQKGIYLLKINNKTHKVVVR